LQSRISKDVNRVSGDQKDSVRTMLDNFRHDLVPNRRISFQELEAPLARFLQSSGSEDDDRCICTVGVVSCPDMRGMSEGNSVIEIHGFAFSLGLVLVNQNDLRRQTA